MSISLAKLCSTVTGMIYEVLNVLMTAISDSLILNVMCTVHVCMYVHTCAHVQAQKLVHP